MTRTFISPPASPMLWPALLALWALAACSDPPVVVGTPDAGTNHCAPGLKPMGPACVPIFDTCQADEVPMLGGGCKRVGVRECPGKWSLAGPPLWQCKPIGPPRTCNPGWQNVQGGWCEPILPKVACGAGTMEVIGHAACQPIGDCGSGTWGKIKATANTIFVDQAYRGSGNGSQSRPYATITAALAGLKGGEHIAVAAGTYNENLGFSRKVTLEGRCAQMVTIAGSGVAYAALELKNWASGSTLRGVTLQSSGVGLYIDGVAVTAERVAVRGCQLQGVEVAYSGSLTLRNSLVAENRMVGVQVSGSKLAMERSVVRDSRPQLTTLKFGYGIEATATTGTGGLSSDVTIRDSLVSGNRGVAVAISSSKGLLERTVVRNTQELASLKIGGTGIGTKMSTSVNKPAELTVRDCLVASNRATGIMVESAKALVENTVVRDTRERVMDKLLGYGIQASIGPGQSFPSEIILRRSLITNNRTVGLNIYSSKALVENTVVQDTKEQVSDKAGGTGIQVLVQPGLKNAAELILRDSLVSGNRAAGVVVGSSMGVVERTVVRDTQEQLSNMAEGSGINGIFQPNQSAPAELTVRDSLVQNNRAVGLSLQSSKGVVERTVIRDTRAQVKGNMAGYGVQVLVQPGRKQVSELTLRDSLVANNTSLAVGVFSSKATVERVLVKDTQSQPADKGYGSGIQAAVQPGETLASTLTLRDSLITGNRNSGVTVVGSSGTVERVTVSNTRQDAKGAFGDGMGADAKATLKVTDCLIKDCARAGMHFVGAGGTVNRTVVRGNIFSVALETGALPTIGSDNHFVDNESNKVTTGKGLAAAPVPKPPALTGSP